MVLDVRAGRAVIECRGWLSRVVLIPSEGAAILHTRLLQLGSVRCCS